MAHAIAGNPTAAEAWRRETLRGSEGFFRVGQDANAQWWLLDPAGCAFFGKAVHGVRTAAVEGERSLTPDSAARLRQWGFNAAGVGGDHVGWDDGFAFMANADFCAAAAPLTGPGLRLPDVFDPQWPALAQQHARVRCQPLAGERALLGWVADDHPGWAQASGTGRPTLLQLCLSLEPSFAAYHAAWEFALALHGNRLESLARAWSVPLSNREQLREFTRAETGIVTRGYLRDEARWTREFARRYFTTTAAALRAADPSHLVLGCRFGQTVGAAVLAECGYPAVDVAMPDWRELPPAGEGGATNPVIAGEVGWTGPDFLKLPTAARLLRLTSVEWMLRRGRSALERAARHPAVVGYAWSRWRDEPGEQPPFASGLVHVNGAEAREHTELLVDLNSRVESLRRSASKPFLS